MYYFSKLKFVSASRKKRKREFGQKKFKKLRKYDEKNSLKK